MRGVPWARANQGQGGGQGEQVWWAGGWCRHAGWLAGWSAEVPLGWGVPQACGDIYIYILVWLLPQPVRSRALVETCVSDHPCGIHEAAFPPVMRLAHLEPAFPGKTLWSNFEGARPNPK